MKLMGMYFVNGATAREFQVWRVCVRFLKFHFWNWRNASSVFVIYLDRS